MNQPMQQMPWGPIEAPAEGPPPGDDETLVSAFEDPELASSLTQAALAPDPPQLEPPPDSMVELPGGWFGPTGALFQKAQVKELTGRDEEKIARIDPGKNFSQWLNTLVLSGTESIGGAPFTQEILNDFLLGDRESLLLGIRIATYGADLETHIICPACGHEEDVVIELDKDVPIKQMEDPAQREFDVELRHGRKAVVTPATVYVGNLVMESKAKTIAEATTATLEHCVLTLDGKPVSRNDILDLGTGDRRALAQKLADLQPGPDYEEVRLDCHGPSCGRVFPLRIDLADLFR